MKEEKIRALNEDIEDILDKIEISFQIKFNKNELQNVKTFGELTSIIISKMEVEETNDCTSQQAFYKLRTAFLEDKEIKTPVNLNTQLIEVFPRKNRKNSIKALENRLNMPLNIFRPKYWIESILIFFLFGSIVLMFFNGYAGFIGFLISLLCTKIVYKLGIEFKINTVGELADKMSKENYIQSRRNHFTANKKEVIEKIEAIFIESLGLDWKSVPADTKFDIE